MTPLPSTALDHLVIGCADLARGAAWLEKWQRRQSKAWASGAGRGRRAVAWVADFVRRENKDSGRRVEMSRKPRGACHDRGPRRHAPYRSWQASATLRWLHEVTIMSSQWPPVVPSLSPSTSPMNLRNVALIAPVVLLAACQGAEPVAPEQAQPASPVLAASANARIPGRYIVVLKSDVRDVSGLARGLAAGNGGQVGYI